MDSRLFAAALAIMLPLSAVGWIVGKIFITLIESITRNPGARDKIYAVAILGVAMTEAIALFALLIAFLVLYS